MARNWLRHHVDAQDGQAVIRKIVVSPATQNAADFNDAFRDNVTRSPQQARYVVERARQIRETRERRESARQHTR